MNKDLIISIKKDVNLFSRKEFGLFTGKAGCCLALYIINKEIHDPELEIIAENILQETIKESSSCNILSLDKGILGVGLAINYLISNDFVNGDLDESLSDIDALLYKYLNKPDVQYGISCTSGLTGFLIYLVERINKCENKNSLYYDINVASLRIVINRLEKAAINQIDDITKDIYTSIINNFPILFVYLKKTLDLNVYSDKICAVVQTWSTIISSYLPHFNVNKLYFAVTIAYLNKSLNNKILENYVNLLVNSLEWDELYKEIDVKIMNMNEGYYFVKILLWAFLMQFEDTTHAKKCEAFKLHFEEKYIPLYEDYLKSTTLNSKKENLYLINGILGVETLKILWPSFFL